MDKEYYKEKFVEYLKASVSIREFARENGWIKVRGNYYEYWQGEDFLTTQGRVVRVVLRD